jgi:hypothetical protein
MNRKTPLVLLALTAVTAIPGTAHANANTADADCTGVFFSMPRGETDTVVTTTLDGRVVRTDVIATFGAPLAFSVASPDQSRPHVWAITVDSRWNDDTAWSEQVPACVAETTATAPTTTVAVTTPPVPTTVPPVVDSTVVTTPRTPTTTVPAPTTTVPFTLPETGMATDLPLFLGVWAVGVGISARTLARRK